REIPGFLAALRAGTLAALAEAHVAALGLLIGAIGIGVTGSVSGYGMLIAVTIFWSVGFHLWASMSSAITLALAKGEQGGRHLGRMSAVGSTATLLALGLAWIAAKLSHRTAYTPYFVLAGACIAVAALLCSRLSEIGRASCREECSSRGAASW